MIQFGDDLMGHQSTGGARAAQLLKAAVTRYVTTLLPNLRDHRVLARIYMDPEELGRVRSFTEGFSREEPFFDIISGVDENVVSTKITGMSLWKSRSSGG